MKDNSVNIKVPTTINFDDLAYELGEQQAQALIIKIDEHQCDVGFSEEIIKKLVSILKPCYDTEEEYFEFLESLK